MTVERYFVDREAELYTFRRMVSGYGEARPILDVCAGGGQGKSWLLRQMRAECRQRRAPCALAEFAPAWQPDPLKLMRELVGRLGDEHFPGFCQRDAMLHGGPPPPAPEADAPPPGVSMEGQFAGARLEGIAGRDLTHLTIEQRRPPTVEEREWQLGELAKAFCRDLAALAELGPVALLFDAWEHALAETADWIAGWLLRPCRDGERGRLIVVLAGRPTCARPFEPWSDWRGAVVRRDGLGDFAFEEVQRYYLEKRGLQLSAERLEAYYAVACRNPKLMGEIADGLEEQP
jgi:hypothetical protein